MLQGLAPLLGVLVVALGAAGALVVGAPGPAREGLADFDHAGHIERGLECVDCHDGVETRASAGVPSIRLCLEECHAEDVEAEDMQRTVNGRFVLGHFERAVEPWWPKLYDLPEHVGFSHVRHVLVGQVPCESCHGDIANATRLPAGPVEATLSMDGCMECHAARGVNNDCIGCHK